MPWMLITCLTRSATAQRADGEIRIASYRSHRTLLSCLGRLADRSMFALETDANTPSPSNNYEKERKLAEDLGPEHDHSKAHEVRKVVPGYRLDDGVNQTFVLKK
ncbi:hypothetical protein BGZ60DRAFT_427175 [Tricladium varicosporioides]|nr:hypothetical protein BGZ60DRAFT_427175 [Hymenoscyphus varicosporioides]